MATEKILILSENSEDDTIEIVEQDDADSNSSVSLNISISTDDEFFYEFPLHRNALKALIQQLIKHL